MSSIVPKVSWFVKEKMRKRFQRCRDAAVRIRYLIVFNLWNGRGAREIEPILSVHNTTVYRVAKRYGMAETTQILHNSCLIVQYQ